MDEHQVGIAEYITSTSGFTGILKHRYNDFQVFEVDLSGLTARLTSTDAPAKEQAGPSEPELTSQSIEEVTAAFAAIAGEGNAIRLQGLLCNILTQQSVQQQQQLQRNNPAPPPEESTSVECPPQSAPAAAQPPPHDQQKQLDMEIDLLPIDDKETRKAIHQFLKSDHRLPSLQTDTVADKATAGDQQPVHNIIRVCRAVKGRGQAGGRQKGQQGGRKGGKRAWRDDPDWEGGANKHLRFVMLKENMETQAALTIVSRMLHCHMKNFGFAGTKDKRGITTQFVTVWKTPAAKLAALNPRLRGIKLGNFEYVASHLQLGQLKGNKFRILMRNVSSNDEQQIASAVIQVRERGFINYFGLQRFGTGSVPTHRVGGALLRGEWQRAVQLIMQGGSGERQEYKEARELYNVQGDIKGALAALPTFLVAERAILQALAKSGPNSYLPALQAIPRTLRSMYMHAWQSWVWNRAASERIRKFGADQAVAGDLVLLQSDLQEGGATEQQNGDTYPEQLLSVEAADDAEVAAGASAASRLASVHVVTAEEAAEGKYSIADVVLPLPGGRVQYPQHEAGWELYGRLAAADGVILPGMTQDEFAAAAAAVQAGNGEAGEGADNAPAPLSHGVRDFQLAELTGDYRKLLYVPTDLAHEVLKYSNPDQDDLLQSDWSQLQDVLGRQQKRQRTCEQLHEAKNNDSTADGRQKDVADKMDEIQASEKCSDSRELWGVVLEFTLPPSCYATMLIRELTKSSTSKAAHRELSCKA